MNRLDIINHLASINNAKWYLEIGVEKGKVFKNVTIPNKIGVDPDPNSKATIIQTSDDFFKENTKTFDIIFIDGLHHAQQVEQDIVNSLEVLNADGYIICHDMLPTNKKIQTVPRISGEWTGDCWKAWVRLRQHRKDLYMTVVDTDYGCGIIKKGKQSTINIISDITFENFQVHKKYWMNIISKNTFISEFNK